MSPEDPQRHVVLVRHAKAAYPHGVPDHQRPLRGAGRRNARAAGRWFAHEGPLPDLVLCSDATRAIHTWEIIAASLPVDTALSIEPSLYEARPDTVIDLLHRTSPEVRTVAVVGHEPTMSGTVLALAGALSDPTALSRVQQKYPTNGIAVLRLHGPWSAIARQDAVLEAFVVPRA